jgi:hypothetical protein
MHLDAHYYAVLAFAVSCGFKKESAKTLAYASQYVDDAKINQLTISGPTYGIPLDCESPPSLINMSTCHSYCRLKTFNHAAMINNTCAFHFVPGCKGDSFAWKMTCEPEGPVLTKIKNAALQENDLVKFGIVLHAWADSYSHQGFSGLLSKANDIDHLHLNTKVYHSKDVYSSFFILWLKRNFFEGSFDNILDRLVPPYGHAQALHYPDEPYIEKWSYVYDKNDIYYRAHNPTTKNNIVSYRKAFESITNLLRQFLENHPSHINNSGEGIKSPDEQLYKILFTKKCAKERENVWLNALHNIKPFTKADINNLKYDDTLWLREAFANYITDNHLFSEKSFLKTKKLGRRIVNGAILRESFAESNWYKYYLGVRWYKKLFHKFCSEEGLLFDHDPYFSNSKE